MYGFDLLIAAMEEQSDADQESMKRVALGFRIGRFSDDTHFSDWIGAQEDQPMKTSSDLEKALI